MDDACSCAASRASAIWRAIGSVASSGMGPSLRDALRQRRTLDELEHQGANAVGLFEAVDVRDVRMVQGREQPRFALEAADPIGIARKHRRQDFERDVAPSFVSRAR